MVPKLNPIPSNWKYRSNTKPPEYLHTPTRRIQLQLHDYGNNTYGITGVVGNTIRSKDISASNQSDALDTLKEWMDKIDNANSPQNKAHQLFK